MSLNLNTKYIPGTGNPATAKIYVIGESPGFEEEKEGEPFVGPAGELLNSVFANNGIARKTDCYIDNLSPYRPKDNDFTFCLGTPELTNQVLHLLSLIQTNKPNIVLGLGGWTLRILSIASELMKVPTITQWRGSVIKCLGTDVKFMATFHPSYILRTQGDMPIFNTDIFRLAEEAKSPVKTYEPREVVIVNDPYQAQAAYEVLSKRPKLSVDIECSGDKLRCIGFGMSKNKAYSFNVESEALPITWSICVKLLMDPKIEKVFHFGTFDTLWMEWFKRITTAGYTHDTMVAQHTMWPELPRSLAYLTSVYTDMPYYKYLAHVVEEDSKEWAAKIPIAPLCKYNGYDCLATFEIHEKQLEEMSHGPSGWINTYNFEIESLPVATNISMTGLPIDNARRAELAAEIIKKISTTQGELDSILQFKVNTKSPKQVSELLYTHLNLPRRTNEGNKLTTNEDAIVSLIGFCTSKIASLVKEESKLQWKVKLLVLERILMLRGFYKLLGTYLMFDQTPDNRVHSMFKVPSTDTGRWACEAFIDGTGTNGQTFPRGDV